MASLSFAVQKLFTQPLVVVQEELLYIYRCVFGVWRELRLGSFYSAVLDLPLSKDFLAVWGRYEGSWENLVV